MASGDSGAVLLLPASSAAAADVTYWIEPCTVMASLACAPEDMDLARWAFAAWETRVGGRSAFRRKQGSRERRCFAWCGRKRTAVFTARRNRSRCNGRRGAEIHVLAEPPNQGDRLLRDAIVYLTCLHESGHALGLNHTRAFPDIMYSFQYGGDIPEYFGRYRRKLMTREDIRKNSGMSPADKAALLEQIRLKSIGESIPR